MCVGSSSMEPTVPALGVRVSLQARVVCDVGLEGGSLVIQAEETVKTSHSLAG